MTLLEYARSFDTTGEAIYSDEWTKENGVYVNINVLRWLDRANIIEPLLYDCLGYDLSSVGSTDNIQYIDGPVFEFLNQTELVIDKEVSAYKSSWWPKRPYFRLRGKRVTEEQAFDIIRRTDFFFSFYLQSEQTISLGHFDNMWFSKNCLLTHHGWCHPSGIIGTNYHTGKLPSLDELLNDMTKIKYAFPYLDFVAALTDYNELPWFIQEHEERHTAWRELQYEDDPEFLKHIQIGIWLHDKAIEFMGPERTRQIYQEYEEKYSEENKDIYVPEYYEDHGIFTADIEYLKRCIAANGLEPDRALSRVPEYIWKK